jgi:hypothetical protein
MESWPVDHRPIKNKQTSNRKSEHPNAIAHAESSAKGPVLYPGNGIAAAAMPRIYRTAIERGTTRLKWDFITYQGKRPRLDSCRILTRPGPSIRTLGEPVVLFPARSRKNTLMFPISEHRMAEEGVRVLKYVMLY